MKDSCTIAILNYNTSRQLVRAIESIKQFAPSTPLLIWDNKSTDNSVDEARKMAPDAEVIASSTNLWFSGGCNAAVASCKSRYVFLMNADVVLESDGTIETLMEYMETDLALIAVTPAIRDSGVLRHQAHNSTTPLMCIARDTFLGKPLARMRWYKNATHTDKQPCEIFRSEKVTNCCCLVRRDAFLEIGGFDTRLILYWTEEEFGRKCHRHKHAQAVVGSVAVRHEHGGSTGSVNSLLIRGIYARDRIKYMQTNFGLLAMLGVELLMLLRPRLQGTLMDYYGMLRFHREIGQAQRDVTAWKRKDKSSVS